QMGSQGNNNIICKLQEKILVGDGGQNAFQLPQTAFTFLGISGREQRNKMVYLFHNLSVVKGGNFSGAFNEIHGVIALYSFDQHSQQRFKIRVFLPLIINGNGLVGKGYGLKISIQFLIGGFSVSKEKQKNIFDIYEVNLCIRHTFLAESMEFFQTEIQIFFFQVIDTAELIRDICQIQIMLVGLKKRIRQRD